MSMRIALVFLCECVNSISLVLLMQTHVSYEKNTFEIMEKIISKNIITAIPGIGSKYAQRLHAVGIKKVSFFSRVLKK